MKKIFVLLLICLSTSLYAHSGLNVETLAKTTKSWDGSTLPAYNQGQPEISVLKITIPPHTKLAMHEHPVINAGVMLKGELTVTTEKGEVLVLKEGEAIVEVVNKWHYGENKSDSDAVIVVFYAGVKGEGVTVKK